MFIEDMDSILAQVKKLREKINVKRTKAMFIGLIGGQGSGKSTICEIMKQYFHNTQTISVVKVSYFLRDIKPNVKRAANGAVNMEDPMMVDEIQLLKCLKQLENYQEVVVQEYNQKELKHTDVTVTIAPADIVIVQGLHVLHWPPVRDMIRFRVFIECGGETRLTRLLLKNIRDNVKNPESIVSSYHKHVRPAYEKYVKPLAKFCHLIINWEQGEDQLKQQLETMEVLINYLSIMAKQSAFVDMDQVD